MTRMKDSFIKSPEASVLLLLGTSVVLNRLSMPGASLPTAPLQSNSRRRPYMPVGLSDSWGDDGEYALPGGIAPTPAPPAPPGGWCFQKDRSGHLVAVPCGGASISSGGGQSSSGVQYDANLQRVQQMLNQFPSSLGRLKADGRWGSKTIARLQEFQRQQGLSVTGHWDDATVARLQAGTAAGVPPSNNAPPQSNNNVQSNVTAPPNNKPPNPGISQSTLIVGACLLGGALFMARR